MKCVDNPRERRSGVWRRRDETEARKGSEEEDDSDGGRGRWRKAVGPRRIDNEGRTRRVGRWTLQQGMAQFKHCCMGKRRPQQVPIRDRRHVAAQGGSERSLLTPTHITRRVRSGVPSHRACGSNRAPLQTLGPLKGGAGLELAFAVWLR